MNNFAYTTATSPQEALAATQAGAAVLAGGTDLVPLMKDEIVTPSAVVDISGWDDGAYVRASGDGLLIGAVTPLSTLAESNEVREQYPALAEACRLSASPQLRNMGTIGGNLLQQTRCWYYRGEHNCWLKGGEVCFARRGENEQHSIFLNSPSESICVSAHPTDPGVALLAYDAQVRGSSPSGPFEMPLSQLFALPTAERRNFADLPPGALITEIALPPIEPGTRAIYLKAMPRALWAFAMASVAAVVRVDDAAVQSASIALGGVAPIPFRAAFIEEQLVGATVSQLDLAALADSLVSRATPLTENGYKVPLLRGLFVEALEQVLA